MLVPRDCLSLARDVASSPNTLGTDATNKPILKLQFGTCFLFFSQTSSILQYYTIYTTDIYDFKP
jgi:hypothetical protein